MKGGEGGEHPRLFVWRRSWSCRFTKARSQLGAEAMSFDGRSYERDHLLSRWKLLERAMRPFGTREEDGGSWVEVERREGRGREENIKDDHEKELQSFQPSSYKGQKMLSLGNFG